MFLILKSWLVSFSKRTLLFFTNNPNVQAISLNTQKSRFSSFLIPVIKTVLFTFCPTRKKKQKKKKNERDNYFDFMNVLLASKYEKIIKA